MLYLEGVGPSAKLGPIHFSPRVNFFSGNNGLGKSFILDASWWVLTRTWARGNKGRPFENFEKPFIEFEYTNSSGELDKNKSDYDFLKKVWSVPKKRPSIPGVVLYAGVDGSFSSWDPARNYWSNEQNEEKIRSYDFSPEEVWRGIDKKSGDKICNGLISDWIFWQLDQSQEFDQLKEILTILSPSKEEPLEPGRPTSIEGDSTRYPSIKMPYGQDVPLIHASAAIRRIAALAYLLVWSWSSHIKISREIKKSPAREIIFLIDEIESHLHPEWQRKIVPALMKVMDAMGGQVPVQLIATTHSPLVLASLEPTFDTARDKIFTIDLIESQVKVNEFFWAQQGDANAWLNEAFGLKQARSIEAENAIEAAEAFMRGDMQSLSSNLNTVEKISKALMAYLPGGDYFLPRWEVFKELKT